MRQCQVSGCTRDADYEVFLYQYAGHPGKSQIYSRLDGTCSFICEQHAAENEEGAVGERGPRGEVDYPFTNQEHARGLTIYRPLDASATSFPAAGL